MARKRTFAPKVHFCAISAPRGGHNHRSSTWDPKSAKKLRNFNSARYFSRFARFGSPESANPSYTYAKCALVIFVTICRDYFHFRKIAFAKTGF